MQGFTKLFCAQLRLNCSAIPAGSFLLRGDRYPVVIARAVTHRLLSVLPSATGKNRAADRLSTSPFLPLGHGLQFVVSSFRIFTSTLRRDRKSSEFHLPAEPVAINLSQNDFNRRST